MATDPRVKEWLRRRDTIKSSRPDQHFEDLARIHLTQRMGFVGTTVEGARRTENLYDGTPMQAERGLANAVGGILRPTLEHRPKSAQLANLQ